VTDSTAGDSLVADAPVDDSLAGDFLAGDLPVADSPVGDSPVTDSTAGDFPAADSMVDDSPAADSPVGDSPVTDSTAADFPAAEAPRGDAHTARALQCFGSLRDGHLLMAVPRANDALEIYDLPESGGLLRARQPAVDSPEVGSLGRGHPEVDFPAFVPPTGGALRCDRRPKAAPERSTLRRRQRTTP